MPADGLDSGFRTFHEIEDILVVHVDLTPDEEREAHAVGWLDQDELARWHRYRFDRSRREFALCRAALRSILCSRLGCANKQLSFGVSEHGKPFGLVDEIAFPMSFNVSHSGRHGLIALAPQGRLGVDVEERTDRHDFDGLSEFVFGSEEQADVAARHGEEKIRLFFTLWTLKEALIKALGTGFSLDPSRFEIPRVMRRDARKSEFCFPWMQSVRWELENLGNADFAAAIAYESKQAINTRCDARELECEFTTQVKPPIGQSRSLPAQLGL